MKKLNERQNNKGFSLVELIVVIAIMVVLVAVLAPVFSKYIESSRRSTDVQNASAIAEGVLADVADGKITTDGKTDVSAAVEDGKPSAIAKAPEVKGNVFKDATGFTYVYHPTSNVCDVYVTEDTGKTYNLAIEGDDTTGATGYKNYKAP